MKSYSNKGVITLFAFGASLRPAYIYTHARKQPQAPGPRSCLCLIQSLAKAGISKHGIIYLAQVQLPSMHVNMQTRSFGSIEMFRSWGFLEFLYHAHAFPSFVSSHG